MSRLVLLLATATVLTAAAARRPPWPSGALVWHAHPQGASRPVEDRRSTARSLAQWALATRWGRRRRDARRDAQLPHWLERLASALRAGEAPAAAIAATRSSTPPPLGPEVGRVAEEVEHGAGLVDALDRWRRGPTSSPAVALAASALALGVATGGEVARAVDQVAATLRDRLEAQAEVVALATQARTSAWVLGAAPLGFTLVIASVEPRVPHLLLGTPVGLGCLTLGLALQAAGAAWMTHIVRSAA